MVLLGWPWLHLLFWAQHTDLSQTHFLLEAQLFVAQVQSCLLKRDLGFQISPTPQADTTSWVKEQAEMLGLTLRPLPWPRPCLFVQTDNRVFWTLTGNRGISLFCQLFLDGFGAVEGRGGWEVWRGGWPCR